MIMPRGRDAGLNLGLRGINSIRNGVCEGRQYEVIATERAKLGASKEREAELAMQVRQLEMVQMQQAVAAPVRPSRKSSSRRCRGSRCSSRCRSRRCPPTRRVVLASAKVPTKDPMISEEC